MLTVTRLLISLHSIVDYFTLTAPKSFTPYLNLSCCPCEVSGVCYKADEWGLAVKPACLALEVSPQGLKLSSGLLVLLDGASTLEQHTVSPTGALMNPLQPCSDAS